MFQSKKGHLFAFGKNEVSGKIDPMFFSWNDPTTKTWHTEINNEAGTMLLAKPLPENIDIDDRGEEIKVIGDDFDITIVYVDKPFIWGVTGPSAIQAEEKV